MQNTQRRCKSLSACATASAAAAAAAACPFRPTQSTTKFTARRCVLFYISCVSFFLFKITTDSIGKHHALVQKIPSSIRILQKFNLIPNAFFLRRTYLIHTHTHIEKKETTHCGINIPFESIVGTWTWIVHGKLPSGFFFLSQYLYSFSSRYWVFFSLFLFSLFYLCVFACIKKIRFLSTTVFFCRRL